MKPSMAIATETRSHRRSEAQAGQRAGASRYVLVVFGVLVGLVAIAGFTFMLLSFVPLLHEAIDNLRRPPYSGHPNEWGRDGHVYVPAWHLRRSA